MFGGVDFFGGDVAFCDGVGAEGHYEGVEAAGFEEAVVGLVEVGVCSVCFVSCTEKRKAKGSERCDEPFPGLHVHGFAAEDGETDTQSHGAGLRGGGEDSGAYGDDPHHWRSLHRLHSSQLTITSSASIMIEPSLIIAWMDSTYLTRMMEILQKRQKHLLINIMIRQRRRIRAHKASNLRPWSPLRNDDRTLQPRRPLVEFWWWWEVTSSC